MGNIGRGAAGRRRRTRTGLRYTEDPGKAMQSEDALKLKKTGKGGETRKTKLLERSEVKKRSAETTQVKPGGDRRRKKIEKKIKSQKIPEKYEAKKKKITTYELSKSRTRVQK